MQNDKKIHCKNIVFYIKNNKNEDAYNKNLKSHKQCSKIYLYGNVKINKKVLKNKCIKNTLISQTKLNNKDGLELNSKINLCNKSNLTQEKDTFKNNVLLAKLCEQKVEEAKSLKLSKEYIKINKNFNKEIKNNKKIINKNNCANNNVYFNECTNKNIYINDIKKSICARVENDKGKFNDKLNINKTNNIKLNNKQMGVNEVNPIGCTLSAKNSLSNKTNVVMGNTSKSIPKRITTAIICMWLFVLCACLALVVGVGYSHSKNNNLQVLPNTTTASGSTFSGGDGTESNPYKIATYADLKTLSTNCNAGEHYAGTYFEVANDITIDNTNSLTDWVPIGVDLTSTGTPINYFSGAFDGANHTITIIGSTSITFTLTSSGALYIGTLFGYIHNGELNNVNLNFSLDEETIFNITVNSSYALTIYYGGMLGGCQSSTINGCSVGGGDTITSNLESNNNFFGGIVGETVETTISDCVLSADISLTKGHCNGFAGIVAVLDGNISHCTVNSSLSFSCSSYGVSNMMGGVVCSTTATAVIERCFFSGNSFEHTNTTHLRCAGVIVASGATIRDCGIIAKEGGEKPDINIFVESVIINSIMGLIAGQATTVERCYVDANITRLSACGDSYGYAGLIAGQATTIKDCYVNVAIATITSNIYSSFGFIVGNVTTATDANGATINPSINNCFIYADVTSTSGSYIYSICKVASSVTLTAHNCVIIGTTCGFTNSNTATKDTTNGLYVVSSGDVNLKRTTTYSGAGANGYTWNSASLWDFDETWGIEIEGETYPTLIISNPSPSIVTINVTTSASTGNSEGVDRYILYKLDAGHNVVNQFVVGNGSVITFEVAPNEKVILVTTYRSYLTWTINGEIVQRYEFTPTEDTTLNISISAPAYINNSLVI